MKIPGLRAARLSSVLALLLCAALACRAQVSPPQPSPAPFDPAFEPDGDLLLAHGQFLEAIDAYSRLPVDPDTLNKIGVAWHHLSALGQARRNYELALSLRPNYPEAISNLGSTYFVERNYHEALRMYQRAFALEPHSAIIAANLGTAYFAEDKYAHGLDAYRTAYALDPSVLDFVPYDMVEATTPKRARARRDYSLAQIFAEQGVDDHAIECLRRAIADGFHDWKHLLRDPAFAHLRLTPEFASLMLGVG